MLTPYSAERYLALLYTVGGGGFINITWSFVMTSTSNLLSVASFLHIICTAVVWLHWRVVLNTCAGNFQSYTSYYDERDCGCIFYARDTLSYFVGSDAGFCYWAAFGLVIPLLFSFVFGCYHVYRVCCRSNKPRSGKMQIRQQSTEIMQLTIEQEDVGRNAFEMFTNLLTNFYNLENWWRNLALLLEPSDGYCHCDGNLYARSFDHGYGWIL